MINRCTGEPPAHLDCARVALTHCPFLSNPQMQRDTNAIPAKHGGGGALVERNSGLSCAWVTRGRGGELFNPGNGPLFKLPEPHTVEWFYRGVPATDAEIQDGFEDAVARLRTSDAPYGPAALENLERRISACTKWLQSAGL